MRDMSAVSRSRGAWRVAAVAVLLAVTVIGLRAHGAFSRTPNSAAAGASGAVLVTVLAAGEGIAVIAFIVVLAMARPQRQKKEDEDDLPPPPFPWWAKVLGVLVALAALITPFAVLFTRKAAKKPPIPVPARPVVPLSGSGKLTAPGPGSIWPLIAGMVIAIAVVLTLTILSRRRRARDRRPNRVSRVAALAEGLAAGSEALKASTEPRAAIIACYAAMERGFAAAGSAPAVADTPAEVLTRATQAGLVRSTSAEALTGLFRRARYSAEPMTSADSDAAASALTQMRADLENLEDLGGLEGSSEPAPAGARP
jgi:multisubunit Na+/H+ antiporter MnhB subunit